MDMYSTLPVSLSQVTFPLVVSNRMLSASILHKFKTPLVVNKWMLEADALSASTVPAVLSMRSLESSNITFHSDNG